MMKNTLGKSERPFDFINILFLVGSPLLTIVLLYAHWKFEAWTPALIGFFFFFYFLSGLSITAGYHRLFAHRSYEARDWVKLFFLVWGASALQNSALNWCSDHRVHHRHVDQEKDPYNINEGFFYAHIGWIFYKDTQPTDQKWARDLRQDPLILWQHRYYWILALVTGFMIPMGVGALWGAPIGGLAIIGLGRIVAVHHCTFFINSLCHLIGKRNFSDEVSARDNFVLAFFTYGEGFHNFHHRFQSDYRNGVNWYHFDPTKWLIRTLAYFNQAKNLRVTPVENIMKAMILMDKKRLGQARNIPVPTLSFADQLSTRVELSLRDFYALKAEYKRFKKEFRKLPDQGREKFREKLIELKTQVRTAKYDFQSSYAAWKVYTRPWKKAYS